MAGGVDGEVEEQEVWCKHGEGVPKQQITAGDGNISTTVRNNPGGKAGRVCEFVDGEEKLLGYLKAQHERYLKEVTQISTPVGKSFDLNRVDAIGCRNCDPRAPALEKVPIAATLRMRDQISFQPPMLGEENGYFLYDRVFSSYFKKFPSCKEVAKASARRVIGKLNSNGAALAAEASYKVRKLFLQGGTQWLHQFDLQQPKLTYLPIHLVLNLQHDSSSVRLTVVPNKEYQVGEGQSLCFSDCIQSVSSGYPRPQKFALYNTFAYGTLHSDLNSMFSSVLYSYHSQLQTLTFCMQTNDLKPTYLLSEAKSPQLFCLKSKSVEFGQKDSPSAVIQALTQCVDVYRQYKVPGGTDPVTEYILEVVDQVCKVDLHMDDLCAGLTPPRLWGYIQVTGAVIPLPACVCEGEICEGTKLYGESSQGNVVCCPQAPISEGLWKKHDSFLREVSEKFFLEFAAVLCKVMNYSNFRLKFIRCGKCDQDKLDELVSQQSIFTPSDEDIGVNRPNKEQMREAICKMRPGQGLTFKGEGEEECGQTHLSHSYGKSGVSLKIKHLVISCTLRGGRKKSTELFSFSNYLQWKQEVSPTLTKRSIFSLLSQNFCFSGRFLAYYKMMMKTLLRQTMLSEPNLGWDTPLSVETIQKLELAIQVYFKLVHKTLAKPERFNSYFAQFFIYLTTDASQSILAQTLTVVSVTNLKGIILIKSQHLELSCFAAHISCVSMPFLELLSLQRGALALYTMIKELEGIGVQIPPQHRNVMVDNRVIMIQVRSPANQFVRRTCHAIAKIQLIFNDMQINPFFNLMFLDQCDKRVNFFADSLTRINWSHSLAQILKIHERLMDTTWLEKQHPDQLPGCYRTVGIPHMSDEEWKNVAGVLEKDLDAFKQTLGTRVRKSEEREQASTSLILSAAAAIKAVKEMDSGPESLSRSGNEKSPQDCDETFEDYHNGENNDISDDDGNDTYQPSNVNGSGLDPISESAPKPNDISDDDGNDTYQPSNVSGNGLDPISESDSKATSVSDDGGKDIKQSDNAVSGEPNNLLWPSDHNVGEKDETVTGGKVGETSPQLRHTDLKDMGRQSEADQDVELSEDWQATLERLIDSHHSKGLGNGSAVAVLGRVYQYIDLVKVHCHDPTGRKERQRKRVESREREKNKSPHKKVMGSSLSDEHFLFSEDLDLAKCKLGEFDFCWNPSAVLPEDTIDKHRIRALQHLLSVFRDSQNMRGFTPIALPAKNMLTIKIQRGRRQRDFLKEGEGFLEVRMRVVQEGSLLERCLLWAAHRFSRGMSIHKAMLGLQYLNIAVRGAEKKLRQISASCGSCNRRRAAIGRDSDKIRDSRMGASDYLKLPGRWFKGVNTVLTDVHGPIYVHHGPGHTATKSYVVCFLEQPLNNFVPIMAASLSAPDLLMAVDTYTCLRKTSCDLVYSDYGSAYSRLQNEYSELDWDQGEEEMKDKAWFQMLTAQQGKTRMKRSGVYVRFAQGRHSAVSAVEVAQFQIKCALHSFNHHRKKEPLTYYQWQFVLQSAAQIISSRPVLISEGRIFSPQTLLCLLGEAGGGIGESGLAYHTKGSRMVTRELLRKTSEMNELRFAIAEAFLTHFIKKSFLEVIDRKQLTRRRLSESVKTGAIFFCERLFKSCNSVTGSLLKLIKRGASGNHGLFKRVSTHQGERQVYVGRGLNNLYYICDGDEEVTLKTEHTLPTYSLQSDRPSLEDGLKGYVTFAPEEEEEEEEKEEKKGEEKDNHSKDRQENKEVDNATKEVITRAGRRIKKPDRLGV